MTHAITSRAPLSTAGTHSPPPATVTNPAIPTRYHHDAAHTPIITPPTQPYALHHIFDAHPSHHHQANSSNSVYYHQPQPYSGPHTQTRPPPFFSPSPPQIPQQHNPNYDAHAHPSHHQWPNNTNNNYYHQPQPYGRPHIQPLPPPSSAHHHHNSHNSTPPVTTHTPPTVTIRTNYSYPSHPSPLLHTAHFLSTDPTTLLSRLTMHITPRHSYLHPCPLGSNHTAPITHTATITATAPIPCCRPAPSTSQLR